MSFSVPDGNYYNTPKNFDKWANGSDNKNKAVNGEKVEKFPMFAEQNAQTYPEDLKQFSQSYINMWDKNGDGAWSKEEFTAMSRSGDAVPIVESEETKKAYAQFYEALYKNLNIDDDKASISAEEFAAHLYVSDVDWEKYAETGSVVDSVDGKLDYDVYQELSSVVEGDVGFQQLQIEKNDFYNYFYAEEVEADVPNSEVQKEVRISKSDLPDGYSINDDKQIIDKDGNKIGRINVSYMDVTNDGVDEKITEFFKYLD